jgi:DNA helicase-2/ATP-dependent DNA helicase PcrA
MNAMARDYAIEPFAGSLTLHIDYERELNPQQLAAVTAPPGPALVLAGAGSGKTRTLIYRVAYLLEQGIPPERLLLLTFTNKAAREMMRRVAQLLGAELHALWGGTFHAVAARLLRRHADRLGYQPGFSIQDRDDSLQMLKACLAESKIDTAAKRFPKADVLAEVFSLAANMRRSIDDVLAQQYDYFEELVEPIRKIQQRFAAHKRAANAMDFDDLLEGQRQLLADHADLRERYQRQFQFLLVDEYQDTNQLQSDLIDLLAARHHNLMAVGDDAQSIYSWRGANFRNILEFQTRYPQARVFKIETNYRSTPEILSLANAAIAPNGQQFAKVLTPARAPGAKPVLAACADGYQQAAFVAQRMLELRDAGVSLNAMAVLYRSHFHALELQLELTRRHIPFAITSGMRFFEQAHIKDVTSYIRLVCNPRDELAFVRLAQLMPGIGPKAAAKLWARLAALLSAAGQPVSAAAAAEPAAAPPPPPAPPSTSVLAAALEQCVALVPKKAAQAWEQWVETMRQLEAEPQRRQSARMIRLVVDAGYDDYLQATYANYRNRHEDLEKLAEFALTFGSPEDFLAELALLSDLGAEDAAPGEAEQEKVRLSTIHQAKGLEFDVVFLIMLCDGLFPSHRSLDDLDAEEEERRLFYVAITRARHELYLSYPCMRVTPGPGGVALQTASRFLADIPEQLIDPWTLHGFAPWAG